VNSHDVPVDVKAHTMVAPATRLQNVRLKNLSFLAKSKNGIFACFFAQT
jgi:hypothetical protein